MAQLTVRQAAQQVGVSRQTMFRKIKDGTVSATIDHQGQKQIDSAELLRVFGALQTPDATQATAGDRPRLPLYRLPSWSSLNACAYNLSSKLPSWQWLNSALMS